MCIHTHAKMQNANYLATASGHAHLAEPGCLCTKQALWVVQAKFLEELSQEHKPVLTASDVGTRSPTWTIAVSWEEALNLQPSKCQVPNHSWVDWWGWWEAGGKQDGKLPECGAWTQDPRPEPRTQPLHHTHIHTHTHTPWTLKESHPLDDASLPQVTD